ncbi:hypothetical protein TEA_015482 [Camellia sinensis var. sinensis]|uniref:SET domain-containing protein n=1 Tax=Camellia sinensis var. sinensis TaxID=542762 RepID=A0A4S4DMD4_CAMSN|nr:hypothetical protein TEA_015482 [Camellia sinensis var. sinensis]
MEDDELHLSNKSAENDEYLLVLELSEDDPLFEKKKKLLEVNGFNLQGHVSLKNSSCPNWLNTTMKMLVQRARIICLDELELYFGGVDVNSSVEFDNPRIELEALHSILSLIDKTLSSGNHKITGLLQDLRNASIDMIQDLGDKIRLETRIVTNYSCDKERHLLQWGESSGVQTKLEVAYVEGAGRGVVAKEDLKVGDIALEIPVSIIISEELVHESDMFPILEKIDGVSSETILLLWSMKEKHNHHSKFKFYFDALPEVFNTGLSFGVNAIMALDGTLLLEEIVQAKEHLRTQYDELFPALCNDHPDIFPVELYTWEQFLWACELWYSNGMKVMFTGGKLQTCLVPIAGFLNHSVCPHVLHFGKVDSATNSLKFPLSRPCNAGEQCYLSYGKFSSSHLVTFYGFLPQGDNPYDVIPLELDATITDCSEDNCPMSNWTNHMVRGTWLSKNHGMFHYGLPPPLLDHFRRAQSPMFQNNIHEKLEIELEVLEDLRSTFEDMLETLGETNLDDSTSWDVKLAMEFKDRQIMIVSSIVTSCYSGCKLVEYELSQVVINLSFSDPNGGGLSSSLSVLQEAQWMKYIGSL